MNDVDIPDDAAIEALRQELVGKSPSTRRRIFEKFLLAALGSIPWVGVLISAAASLKFEQPGVEQDRLQTQWLEEYQRKLADLRKMLDEVANRFENLGDTIDDRIQTEEYLTLVRGTFRAWDRADTEEKRKCFANLITNAAGTRLCSDDVIRLFIDWLDTYHESHLAVIRAIYNKPGITRYEIWRSVWGDLVREDSAEADLYRMLIRDLSIGGVIRQERDVTNYGQFRRHAPAPKQPRSDTMESSFEDTKPYELTALGKQFVHYTMSEIIPRLEGETNSDRA